MFFKGQKLVSGIPTTLMTDFLYVVFLIKIYFINKYDCTILINLFQGNIIEYGKSEAQTGSIYKLSGKIINHVEQFDEEKMINENDLFQLQTNWLPIMEGENEDSSSDFNSQTRCISNRHLSKLSKSDGESSSNSPESSLPLSSQGSGSGYLDSDLVKAAIERLNFDDSEVTITLIVCAISIKISL